MYKFWINIGVLYPKMYIWSRKKNCAFYTKNEVFAKKFTKMYKFWINTGVWYPKMYIWFRKMEKFVLFTLKMKFLPKRFH